MEDCVVRKFVMLRKKGDQVSSSVPVMIELSKKDIGTINRAVTFVNTTPEICVLIVCLKPAIVLLDEAGTPLDLVVLDSVNIRINTGQLISLEVESPRCLYVSDIINRPYPDMIQSDVVIGDGFKALLSDEHNFRESLRKRLDTAVYERLLNQISYVRQKT